MFLTCNDHLVPYIFLAGIAIVATATPANGRSIAYAGDGGVTGYTACCEKEQCIDIPGDPVGCDPAYCVSIEHGEFCHPDEVTANCSSDPIGTICTPVQEVLLGFTAVADPLPVPGCCVVCPQSGKCEHCTDVSSHKFCGALFKANCKLEFGDFNCEQAQETTYRKRLRFR